MICVFFICNRPAAKALQFPRWRVMMKWLLWETHRMKTICCNSITKPILPNSTVQQAKIAHKSDSCWKCFEASENTNVFLGKNVKLFDFFNLSRVYRWIDFALEKIFSMLPQPSAKNLDPPKTEFSKFFFPKKNLTFHSRLFAFTWWLKSLKQKKTNK